MKKLIYLLLLVPFCVNAQIVNIPDANFKAKLLSASPSNQVASADLPNSNGSVTNYHTIDTNGDGEIQVSEANLIKTMYIYSSSISNLEGISYFNNLQILICFNNQITNLDVTSLTNLKELYCYNNDLIALNLGGLTSLQRLDCSFNELSNLNFSNLTGLQYLDIYSNNFTSLNLVELSNLTHLNYGSNHLPNLDLSILTNLEYLDCSSNQIPSLNLSGLTNLKHLDCSANQIPSIDLSGLTNMQYLNCSNNQIPSLNLNGLVNLTLINCINNQIPILELNGLTSLHTLNCDFNQIPSLNLNGLVNLYTLTCSNNQIPSIDLIDLVNLGEFNCSNNQISSLDLNSQVNLSILDCSNNQISSLDVSSITTIFYLDCSNNQLNTFNAKNGYLDLVNLFLMDFSNNPNLNFICVNEDDLSFFEQKIIEFGIVNCNINSYCSFVPGGDYNIITGPIQFDQNSNGCDVNDALLSNIKININDGTNQGATFTNNTGNYNFYTQAGSFDLTPDVENPTFFTFSPASATIPFADNNNNTTTQNFCITANGVHPDIEVVIMPITPARPGFDATYQIVYKNKGNQTLSGNVNLTFEDDKTDFVSSNPNPDNLNLNSLSWNYTNLLPFESRTINVKLNVNSPQETPAVNIGDQLGFEVVINPVINDEIPLDNSFTYNQIVVGSFDPNTIECLEGEVVAPSYIGQYLHYAVNFENTGNYPAENIVVKIVVDTTKYNINSLQLLNVSHNSYTRVSGNIIEIIFQEINLDSGGHGNLLFKIRTNSNLVEGNSVDKRANIFFDYNAPIDTGMANTTFEVLSNSVFELDNSISISPNPTKGMVNINCNNTIKSVELYDVQGRLLQSQLLDEVQTSIDLTEQSNGIYFLKITSDKGSKVEKIMKE